MNPTCTKTRVPSRRPATATVARSATPVHAETAGRKALVASAGAAEAKRPSRGARVVAAIQIACGILCLATIGVMMVLFPDAADHATPHGRHILLKYVLLAVWSRPVGIGLLAVLGLVLFGLVTNRAAKTPENAATTAD